MNKNRNTMVVYVINEILGNRGAINGQWVATGRLSEFRIGILLKNNRIQHVHYKKEIQRYPSKILKDLFAAAYEEAHQHIQTLKNTGIDPKMIESGSILWQKRILDSQHSKRKMLSAKNRERFGLEPKVNTERQAVHVQEEAQDHA